jgi:BCD family chlorophyll transporter-like MFS transporter
MLLKRFQLGLIHVAVAMTLVPINSTLNRVMIKEMALSATLVAVLASLPYLFSPVQVMIGSFADRHPIFGWRRTPYIFVGLVLCVLGLALSPYAAFAIEENFWSGIWLGILAFGAWGMGYNFASVSYLSLASEISGETGRGRTIAVMFLMMIVSLIFTAEALRHMVDPYTAEALVRAVWIVGLMAFVLGLLGLIKLERRTRVAGVSKEERYSWGEMAAAILENRQATLFFVYLAILLTALLGHDILLEPFGGEAFGMPIEQTTRFTSIWGTFTLVALLLAAMLERRTSKLKVATWGGWGAFLGFVLIALSGVLTNTGVFYTGMVLLGFGTGLATVSNLSLMLDMTTVTKVGLFIGAWGMSNAVSRLAGSVIGGAVRDTLTRVLPNPATAYVLVFGIMAILILVSLLMLRRIDVAAFRQQADKTSTIERAALAGEV